jgi:crotonobetainyl-CoA:carnitine CoA-transferase CaiB-like acyl-CoA transferase
MIHDNSSSLPSVETRLPLEGIRVLEIGQLLAGPFCGQLLGDFGAEVIKIEQPGIGDPMREWGREKSDGESLWWPTIARNKKSVTLDLRKSAGQKTFIELAKQSDIVVENFRPKTIDNWGIGYADVSKVNSRIIMVHVSGFGQTGPYSSRAGYGSIGEAMGGLRHIVGDPSSPPSRMGISIGDSMAGICAAFGCLVAVRELSLSGRGQEIDAAIYESVLAFTESLVTEYQLTGFIRERTGPIIPNVAPSNIYPTLDNTMVLIAANQDTVFVRLADAMNEPDLKSDERFSSHTARGNNQELLDTIIATWTSTLKSDHLVEVLEEHGVPTGKIYRAPEMLEDPHFEARESIAELPSDKFGSIKMPNVVPKLSRTPGRIRWTGPTLGEHNDEIFRSLLGMSSTEIDATQ